MPLLPLRSAFSPDVPSPHLKKALRFLRVSVSLRGKISNAPQSIPDRTTNPLPRLASAQCLCSLCVQPFSPTHPSPHLKKALRFLRASVSLRGKLSTAPQSIPDRTPSPPPRRASAQCLCSLCVQPSAPTYHPLISKRLCVFSASLCR